MTARSPRDRFLTVYGRMPVLEALRDPSVPVSKVFVAHQAHGETIAEILTEARRRSVQLERVEDEMISALARSSRHHQGVAADVAAPDMCSLEEFLERRRGRLYRTSVLLIDSVHNPANVGMIIRSATAAGLDAIIVPSRGTAELGPLVIKASLGWRSGHRSCAVTTRRELRPRSRRPASNLPVWMPRWRKPRTCSRPTSPIEPPT